MRGPDLVGTAPSNVRFSADGRSVYFRWRTPGIDTLDADYRVIVAAPQAPERLPRFAVDTIAMAAEGLRGRLLICHGMVDDNVHFQDTARADPAADRAQEDQLGGGRVSRRAACIHAERQLDG